MAHFIRRFCAAGALVAVCSLSLAAPGSDAQDESKGTVVELDILRSRTPANWKQETPNNPMRFMQFALPKVAGDIHDAEIVIHKRMGGNTQQNIERWKNQFIPPEGKSIANVSTVTTMKVAIADITYVDIQGTYKLKDRPLSSNAIDERRPNFRMLGVVFEVKGSFHFIRFVGPARTVEHYKKGFDDWLRAFQ